MEKKTYELFTSRSELDPTVYKKFTDMNHLYCLYKDRREVYLELKEMQPNAPDESVRQAALQKILCESTALTIKRL